MKKLKNWSSMDKKEFWTLSRDRNIRVLGFEIMNKIRNALIAVFGLGGVGGILCELLIRSGFQNLIVSDNTKYEVSNINRQIGATSSTIGLPKAIVMHQRLLDIDPTCHVIASTRNLWKLSFLQFSNIKVIANCVDKVKPQIEIAEFSRSLNTYMIIGGVIGDGTKGVVTSFDPRGMRYEEIIPIHGIRGMAKDIDTFLKRKWLQLNKENMPSEILNNYRRNLREPYPVLTTIPYIVAGIMVQEIIKIVTEKFEPIIAPKVIVYDGWSSTIRILNITEESIVGDVLVDPIKEGIIPWRP
jgi:tRNA A37 threonylcarbamoyladenosine dehydratase